MTKAGVKRIEISPEILKGLRAEAALLGIGEKELVNKLILDGLSLEVKEFVGLVPKSDIPKKRFIDDDPKALEIIKENYGKMSIGEIAKLAKWPKSTVHQRIQKMLADGEISSVDRP